MTVLNIILLVVAVGFGVAAIVSILLGVQARSRISSSSYGVQRQQSRQIMLMAFLRAAVFAVLALIVLGVYGLSLGPEDVLSVEPEPGFTPPAPTATVAPTETATAAVVATEPPVVSVTPSPLPATATPTSTATPTITPTPVPVAVVTSEVGLYLRETPSNDGAVIELLPVGTELVLLDEQQSIDGEVWERVEAPSGAEGWVAVEYIEYR